MVNKSQSSFIKRVCCSQTLAIYLGSRKWSASNLPWCNVIDVSTEYCVKSGFFLFRSSFIRFNDVLCNNAIIMKYGKRELIRLLLFTCYYVVSVWRGFLFLWVLGMGYVILLWHCLSLPYNYSELKTSIKRHLWLQNSLCYILKAPMTLLHFLPRE